MSFLIRKSKAGKRKENIDYFYFRFCNYFHISILFLKGHFCLLKKINFWLDVSLYVCMLVNLCIYVSVCVFCVCGCIDICVCVYLPVCMFKCLCNMFMSACIYYCYKHKSKCAFSLSDLFQFLSWVKTLWKQERTWDFAINYVYVCRTAEETPQNSCLKPTAFRLCFKKSDPTKRRSNHVHSFASCYRLWRRLTWCLRPFGSYCQINKIWMIYKCTQWHTFSFSIPSSAKKGTLIHMTERWTPETASDLWLYFVFKRLSTCPFTKQQAFIK